MGKITAVLLTTLLFFAARAYAADPDCSMCHPEKSTGKSVHAAVAMMGCLSCHTGVDASSIPHKLTGKKGLPAEGADLCYTCHDKGLFSGKKSVHMPVAGGMCTSCHDPHSSGSAKLLVADNVCLNCHDASSFKGKKSVHYPVAQGSCPSCHYPHQSDTEKLLRAEAPDLCYGCHDKTKFYGPTIHAPVGIGVCGACHAPHQSDHGKLLAMATTELCYECHDRSEFQKKFIHKPVAEGKCTECHFAHASENRSLVYRKGNLLCRKCHPNVERVPHGVAGMRLGGHPVRGKKDPMRPGRTFECLSCHLPHSSDSLLLFRFKAASMFDICINCHEM